MTNGSYYVSTYEVNEKSYLPIANNVMEVNDNTMTFANGQIAKFNINDNKFVMANSDGSIILSGTIKLSNEVYTVIVSNNNTTIKFVFKKYNQIKIQSGNYAVSTYEVNGETYSPIANNVMEVNDNTMTFANGQIVLYEINGSNITIKNFDSSIELKGTISLNNNIFAVHISNENATIIFTFQSYFGIILQSGDYFVSTYEINGESYSPIASRVMQINGNTMPFANEQMAIYEINGSNFKITNISGQILLNGTISINNDIYKVESLNGDTKVTFIFEKYTEIVIQSGEYNYEIYQVNGDGRTLFNSGVLQVNGNTITFSNGIIATFEIDINKITITQANTKAKISGTIRFQNGEYTLNLSNKLLAFYVVIKEK